MPLMCSLPQSHTSLLFFATGISYKALLDEDEGLLACTKKFDPVGMCIDTIEKDTMAAAAAASDASTV